ncbi:glycosyltransferase family 2 protein [Cohaesibacter sp. CAU 1516]|uniref:glycosyltransferase family 2 protein n=1 Tax=Cohaesibacter sp. CAU 1516 TaxID=2576038 RepID=UPI0010FCF51B|nr:glycosyltransferase family 2 protein [Cohaesibacter sp. CAU 1516]TLP42337.1 glycosyltransferase family 2 protein [Cohaesibacter sp. CAU 1516]
MSELPQKVTLAICTRGRSEMIAKRLKSLRNLTPSDSLTLSLVICNNNIDAYDNDTQTRLLSLVPASMEAEITHQPRPGIPFARNRAIDAALKTQPDWIAFIDDDEELDTDWLIAMSQAMQCWSADVYHGWTQSFPDPAASHPWYFGTVKNKRSAGTEMKSAGTDNVLFSAKLVDGRKSALRFNEEMAFSGGTDLEFFYRVTDNGGTIVWVPDAIVRETIPASRMTLSYQAKRAGAVASAQAFITRHRLGPTQAALSILPKVTSRLLGAITTVPVSIILIVIKPRTGRKTFVSAVKKGFFAIGMIRGSLCKPSGFYKRIHGA